MKERIRPRTPTGRGGMSRREFLRLSGAGPAGTSLLGSGALAGCGGGSGTTAASGDGMWAR